MTRRLLLRMASFAAAGRMFGQTERTGPRPPKKDLPYLLEASRLIPTEAEAATESRSKQGQTFSVPGTTSPARTPLPEPIFLFSPDRISAGQLSLFRFEIKDGRREVSFAKHSEGEESQGGLHITVRKLDSDLYRIEAAEMLDPGEYSLSPQGANTAFCFTVY